jgi:dTDP-4-dehydrorhamnose 3,5-epimerase
MKFQPLAIDGSCLVIPEPISDNRGFFTRTYCMNEFTMHGLNPSISQCNLSYNVEKYTLRGMHYQRSPYEEVKYIRCIRGSIYDVFIDLRPESPTRYKWYGVPISDESMASVYVPAGCAHGFMTLEDKTLVQYQSSGFYVPQAEKGVRYDDPKFNIVWPHTPAVISDKDANWEDYK